MTEFVLACLCAFFCVSMAQVPPVRPVMPETFTASGEVEVHQADMTGFGEFEIARSEAAEMGLEMETYDGQGRKEISESLYRYFVNTTYYIRGDANDPHCLVEDRNFNGMPKYWSFLEYANYEGTDEVRNIDYDLWAVNIGGVRYEFGKPRTNSSILYTYRRKSAELSVFYSFMKFSAFPPSNSMFDVPQACKDMTKN